LESEGEIDPINGVLSLVFSQTLRRLSFAGVQTFGTRRQFLVKQVYAVDPVYPVF
jgi:hypothetical protein